MAPANPTNLVGATQQFTATGTYSDSSTQNVTGQATWSSSKTTVATINTNGLATAVSAGATVISAALSGVTATNTLTVQAAPLVMSTTSMPTGTVSVAYSAALLATGGTTPYTWGIASGSLPGGVALNTATGAVTGTPTNAGTFTFTARVSDAGSPQQVASNALSITISSAPASVTIWPSTAVPTVADDGPDSSVELGVKFRSDVNGELTGIRFYKAAANTGTHVGNLWSTNGTLLGSITFSNETASGWQQMLLASPVAITSNTVYVASYHCTIGHYSEDDNYFASKGVDNPPLHALANTVSADGVYSYGSSSAFPSSTWESANYWVDVTFVPSAANSNAPPTITTQPQSVSVLVSNAATFNVTASGGGTLSYQWSMGGTNVTGATASSWTVTLDTPQTNTVFVSISSIYGSIVSSNAIYAVIANGLPEQISVPPANASVQVKSNAIFSVTASGTPPLNYQWSWYGTNLAGATTSKLTISNVTYGNNNSVISVACTNAYGGALASAKLTVTNTLPPGSWYLTFDDEFPGNTLNTNLWNPTGWVDNPTELEAYTTTNVVVTNGMVKLWAYHQTYGTNNYTSGKITTMDKFWQKYGYFEASISVPRSENLWPVYWMLMEPYTNNAQETSWPPEVDIMEITGMPGGAVTSLSCNVAVGGNYPLCGGGLASWDYVKASGLSDLTTGFHAYGYQWTPTNHTFWVDGVKIGSTSAHPYTNYPMWVILQLAILEEPVGALPAAMEVNYVRVYASGVSGTNP
jgi:beta-glucanase (GH16 family)